MASLPAFPSAAQQRGAALLIFMLIFVTISLSLLLSRLGSITPAPRNESTMQTLAQAKEALIGWSAADPTRPGKLPCPEDTDLIGTASEGRALSSCSNSLPQVGRLPWRTLGLPDLRDDEGERLWYALSPGFRNSPINSETPAQLTVDTIPDSAVAIIFSAGAALPGQIRPVPTAAAPPDVAQYLDMLNNSGTGSFITTGSAGLFNDRMTIISARDLFNVVEKRVAREVRQALLNHFCGTGNTNEDGSCIAAGGNRFFPRPARFNDPTCLGTTGIDTDCNSGIGNNAGRIPANPSIPWSPPLSLLRGTITSTPNWFQVNAWREQVYYAVAPACIDGTFDCDGTGKLTVNQPPASPAPNQRVVIIVTGKPLSTTSPPQDRSIPHKINSANYLEDENLSPLDDVYTRPPTNPSTPFNDQVFMLP